MQILLEQLRCFFLCIPRPKKQDSESPGTSGAAGGENSLLDKTNSAAAAAPPVKPNHQQDWQNIVKVLDRLMFMIFGLYMLLCIIVFFPKPY